MIFFTPTCRISANKIFCVCRIIKKNIHDFTKVNVCKTFQSYEIYIFFGGFSKIFLHTCIHLNCLHSLKSDICSYARSIFSILFRLCSRSTIIFYSRKRKKLIYLHMFRSINCVDSKIDYYFLIFLLIYV